MQKNGAIDFDGGQFWVHWYAWDNGEAFLQNWEFQDNLSVLVVSFKTHLNGWDSIVPRQSFSAVKSWTIAASWPGVRNVAGTAPEEREDIMEFMEVLYDKTEGR